MQGLASHWDLVRMHFMVWRPRARAAARARWYDAVDGAVTASVAQAAAQRAAVSRVAAPVALTGGVPAAELVSREPVALLPAAGTAAIAVQLPASQAASRTATVADPSPRPVSTAAPEGKPAAQGQGRLVSLVARATGSWRGPRPSLVDPSAERPASPAALPQLELQRSSSSPLTSQLRARFEGLAAFVVPDADAETAARRKALGGFSRRRLQVSSPLQAPRGVAVH